MLFIGSLQEAVEFWCTLWGTCEIKKESNAEGGTGASGRGERVLYPSPARSLTWVFSLDYAVWLVLIVGQVAFNIKRL